MIHKMPLLEREQKIQIERTRIYRNASIMIARAPHPTAQHARSIRRQLLSSRKERNHARAKELLQHWIVASVKRVCCAALFLSEFTSDTSSFQR